MFQKDTLTRVRLRNIANHSKCNYTLHYLSCFIKTHNYYILTFYVMYTFYLPFHFQIKQLQPKLKWIRFRILCKLRVSNMLCRFQSQLDWEYCWNLEWSEVSHIALSSGSQTESPSPVQSFLVLWKTLSV